MCDEKCEAAELPIKLPDRVELPEPKESAETAVEPKWLGPEYDFDCGVEPFGEISEAGFTDVLSRASEVHFEMTFVKEELFRTLNSYKKADTIVLELDLYVSELRDDEIKRDLQHFIRRLAEAVHVEGYISK